ncbi:hypothetical protein BD310DRAFT_918859 [Dichomitus squalens]|uniref:Uncharacterized protein n=1 Tax=Dichomitus squalens TaxID=114155 RepID=A0A4Q9Q5C5_9APHY|nr:hypothetical protein BD310DRAFT_918859 [Dichomitus squalens]
MQGNSGRKLRMERLPALRLLVGRYADTSKRMSRAPLTEALLRCPHFRRRRPKTSESL